MSHDDKSAGDRFLALLRPIERDLETYCRRMIWDQPDAPDAIQNAVMNAFRAFDRYHDNTNFRGWMFTILTREVFKLNKKFARLAQSEFRVDAETLDALAALEQSAEFTDLDQHVVSALKTLTETERAVLLLRGIGEFRYREIAESLEIPMGSVMGHLARARKKMQDALLRFQRRSVL